MSSLFGYIFGKKSKTSSSSSNAIVSNQDNVELIHTLLDDEDFILVSDIKDQNVKVNVSSSIPIQQNDELDFERIEMSVANLVDFMPTLFSSSNRNSIRQQILEDEEMKERFRLFLQEQHQSSMRRMSTVDDHHNGLSSGSNSELSSPSSSPIIHDNNNNTVENTMEQFSSNNDNNMNTDTSNAHNGNDDNGDDDNGDESRRHLSRLLSSTRTPSSISAQSLKIAEKNRSKQTRKNNNHNTSVQHLMRKSSSITTSVNHSRQSHGHSKRFQNSNIRRNI